MNILHSTQDLVEEELAVIVLLSMAIKIPTQEIPRLSQATVSGCVDFSIDAKSLQTKQGWTDPLLQFSPCHDSTAH